jgi:hypothetical protein
MKPYIGDRQLEPDDNPDEDIECPCGSGAYTIHGFCHSCDWANDPGEPNDYPDED